MFVCSVSTVVFNGNPLLRYDGYYILSDLLEIPNLRQKATTILGRKLGAWCLGLEEPDDPFLPQRNQAMFMLYTVASTLYSWIVVFSILFFLNKVFKPYRLEIFGQMIAFAAIVSLVGRPLWTVWKYFQIPGRSDQVKKPRLYATIAIVSAVVGAFLFLPLPYRVYCTLEVQPHKPDPVYVDVGGELKTLNVKPGQSVEAGTMLAELKSIDLELAVAELTGKRDQLSAQLDGLRRQRFQSSDAQMQIPQIQKSLDSVEEELREKKTDLDRLHLVARRGGVVFPPPSMPKRPKQDGKLATWNGTPLEMRNLGATFQPGTLFCQIGDPDKFDAIMVVDQVDIESIHLGQKVKVMLDESPGKVYEGDITEISPEEMKVVSKQLSNKSGGSVETKTDESGVPKPASTSYEARVPLDDSDGILLPGLKGEAKISADYHSLGWRDLALPAAHVPLQAVAASRPASLRVSQSPGAVRRARGSAVAFGNRTSRLPTVRDARLSAALFLRFHRRAVCDFRAGNRLLTTPRLDELPEFVARAEFDLLLVQALQTDDQRHRCAFACDNNALRLRFAHTAFKRAFLDVDGRHCISSVDLCGGFFIRNSQIGSSYSQGNVNPEIKTKRQIRRRSKCFSQIFYLPVSQSRGAIRRARGSAAAFGNRRSRSRSCRRPPAPFLARGSIARAPA